MIMAAITSTKTILITGASTGIGKATALLFQKKGWNVIATMRSPEKGVELQQLDRCAVLPLDVTDIVSIERAIAAGIERFGPIDAVVNNAGYALMGAFEPCDPAQIEKQFATNVFGLMAVIRALLPHFRQKRSGTIINVASMGGRITFPAYTLYHSTKWAVEGFSESLQYELAPFNIRVKIIEPGPIKTDFYDRSADVGQGQGKEAYQTFLDQVMPPMDKFGQEGSPPEAVAEVIFKAATDSSKRLRYPAGSIAGWILLLRKVLPDPLFFGFVHQFLKF
jgi:NAD(P)-dependent dehydrogenase (short-subunit alcohol dehydrogenase family)